MCKAPLVPSLTARKNLKTAVNAIFLLELTHRWQSIYPWFSRCLILKAWLNLNQLKFPLNTTFIYLNYIWRPASPIALNLNEITATFRLQLYFNGCDFHQTSQFRKTSWLLHVVDNCGNMQQDVHGEIKWCFVKSHSSTQVWHIFMEKKRRAHMKTNTIQTTPVLTRNCDYRCTTNSQL